MNTEEFRKVVEAHLNAPPPPPLETTRKFLGIYFADAAGLEEIRETLNRRVTANPAGTLSYLAAIEALSADPPDEEGVLSEMVAWDGNWVLDDPSDEGARQFLREVAEMIRDVLGEQAPPRPATVSS